MLTVGKRVCCYTRLLNFFTGLTEFITMGIGTEGFTARVVLPFCVRVRVKMKNEYMSFKSGGSMTDFVRAAYL